MRLVFPSAKFPFSIALKTFDVRQRIFSETWISVLGRTRMRSPSGSMPILLAGSILSVVPIFAVV